MNKKYAKDCTIRELMAVFISRDIQDGEVIGGGGAQPVPRAGQLLAHLHHGPNMKFQVIARQNLYHIPVLPPFELFNDWRVTRWAESYWMMGEIFDDLKIFRKRIFFTSGIQIDKYGNTNLFGVGDNYKRLKFKGPGGMGAATASSLVNRYHIFANSHNKRIFVEKCDFISCLGWGNGGKDARKKLGLPGGGPKYCITPLCIMDFEEESKRMRLKSLHPGVALDEVVNNTGFELIIPAHVPQTEPPTEEELEILRTRVDPEGTLRS